MDNFGETLLNDCDCANLLELYLYILRNKRQYARFSVHNVIDGGMRHVSCINNINRNLINGYCDNGPLLSLLCYCFCCHLCEDMAATIWLEFDVMYFYRAWMDTREARSCTQIFSIHEITTTTPNTNRLSLIKCCWNKWPM